MINILLISSDLMLSALLELDMNKAANKFYPQHQFKIEAHSIDSAKASIDEWDIFLLGPQEYYYEKGLQALTKAPVTVLPIQLYELSQGKKVISLVCERLKIN